MFLALTVVLGTGAMPRASAQTPTATPNGEFLCTVAGSVSPDGKACNSDDDCVPNGVCVIAQPVCNGGTDDGAYCGCIGVNCVAASPVCDASLTGVCPSGPNAGECCDVASNCSDGAPCIGAQKVCIGGDFKAVSCLNDGQCPGSVCRSTGKFCNGGDFDGFSCVDNADCTGSPAGTCDSAAVATPLPTNTRTATKTVTIPVATRTATPTTGPGTVAPTATRTPTNMPTSGTVGPSATPTLTPTTPLEVVARLTRAISASDLTIPVDDAQSLPASGRVQIDNEVVSYLGKSRNVLTGVTRGVAGTTPASHALGSQVLAVLALASPTPRPTPTEPTSSGSINVVGKGGGCSLAGVAGSTGAVWAVGVALALAALRRKRTS